jgi:hypothetical protein
MAQRQQMGQIIMLSILLKKKIKREKGDFMWWTLDTGHWTLDLAAPTEKSEIG